MKKQISVVLLFGLTTLFNAPLHSAPDSFMAKLCSYVPVKACVATGLGLFGAAAYCHYKKNILGDQLSEINARIKSIPPKREYLAPNHATAIQQIKALKDDLDAFIQVQGPVESYIEKLDTHFKSFAKLRVKKELVAFIDAELSRACKAVSQTLQSIDNSMKAIKTHGIAGGGRSSYNCDEHIKNLAEQEQDLKTINGPAFSKQLLYLVDSLKRDQENTKAEKQKYEAEYAETVQKINKENRPYILKRARSGYNSKINSYWNWLEIFSKAGTSLMLVAAISAYFTK